MAYKTISVSVEAYEVLKRAQKQGESFSKEILRLATAPRLLEVAGIYTDEEAKALRKGVEEVRKNFRVRQWR